MFKANIRTLFLARFTHFPRVGERSVNKRDVLNHQQFIKDIFETIQMLDL